MEAIKTKIAPGSPEAHGTRVHDKESVNVDTLWRHLLSSDQGFTSRESPATTNALDGDKRWLHLDHLGRPRMISINRHDLIHSLKLRYRDLVVVDPTLPIPVPSVILVRARAIVVNLDVGGVLRLVICHNQVYVLSVPKASDPAVTAMPTLYHPLVRRLSRCLRPAAPSRLALDVYDGDVENGTSATEGEQRYLKRAFTSTYLDVENMPYELRALEIALSAAIGILTDTISRFEATAYPTVDALLERVDRGLLESVRAVKNTIDRLQSKVRRVHTELSELLADDADMADLYLGRRAAAQGMPPLPQPHEANSSESSLGEDEDEETLKKAAVAEHVHARRKSAQSSVIRVQRTSPAYPNPSRGLAGRPRDAHEAEGRHRRRRGRRARHAAQQERKRMEAESGPPSARNKYIPTTAADLERNATDISDVEASIHDESNDDSSSASSETSALLEEEEEHRMLLDYNDTWASRGLVIRPHDIEEAEDMLEAFFERADMLLRRLSILDERVDDTEDLLELDLDQRRNELVGLNLLVASVAMSFGFSAAVAGFFGMNLANAQLAGIYWVLALVLALTISVSVLLLILVLWWVRKRKLMFIPTSL